MNSHGDYEERPSLQKDAPTNAQGSLSLEDAALDLVLAATEEGQDAVIRTLLRSLVALGLTPAASYWVAPIGTASAQGPIWTQHRGFGGPTPPPDLDLEGRSANPRSKAPGAPQTLPFGPRGAIVTLREAFDADGRREDREDEVESLVLLAGTLLVESQDYPAETYGETGREHGTPGPLPGPAPESGNRRQSG